MEYINSISSFLKYGLLGLVVAMTIPTFFLLKEESKKEKPRKIMLLSIMSFYSLCIISALGAGWIDYLQNLTPKVGKIMGSETTENFIHGGSAKALTGLWSVQWYSTDKHGKQIDYYVHRKIAKEKQMQNVELIADGSQVLFIGRDLTTEAPRYWMYGRASFSNSLSVIYWGHHEKSERALTGTVFLEIIDEIEINQPLKMKGWWRGHSRDNEVEYGEVEMVKLD